MLKLNALCSFHLWNVDTLDLWVEVLILKTITFHGISLHFIVVECADGVQVRQLLQLLELFLGLVQIKHLLDAVKVLSHVVLVLVYTESFFDLIFIHFCCLY